MKKGQTALEYLITYGWAILVILVVLAVLWYYGIFNPSRWAGEQVGAFSAFNVMDHKFSNDGLDLVLANRAGKDVTIKNVSVFMTGDRINDFTSINQANITQVVRANTQETVSVAFAEGLGGNPGDIMSLTVSILYDTEQLTDKVDSTTMNLKVA